MGTEPPEEIDVKRLSTEKAISAVDLFCGVGGLTHGLLKAGISVAAGIDIDEMAEYAYTSNNPGATFLRWDVSQKYAPSIEKLFIPDTLRLLAGCAPCQPFSKLTNGIENHKSWDMLKNFARFVSGFQPELVTMENVPELVNRGREVFNHFVSTLTKEGYFSDWRIVNCAEYGAPQSRRRLVLLASRLGPISIPAGGFVEPSTWKTVRQAIGGLPPLESGGEDATDPLHVASRLSPMNLKRIRATRFNGGNRRDWPDELVLECHRRKTGARYHSIYGRMWWDKPAPTMTTLCTGIGNGRFGHPEQDRSITLREAAILQTFPRNYAFWPPTKKTNRSAISRMIGNAVPPILGEMLGSALVNHVETRACGAGPST